VLTQLVDLLLHADVYLQQLVATYGTWVYGILFAIVFAETGLVVTPFLPGDSLLFAAGALAGGGHAHHPASEGRSAVGALDQTGVRGPGA